MRFTLLPPTPIIIVVIRANTSADEFILPFVHVGCLNKMSERGKGDSGSVTLSLFPRDLVFCSLHRTASIHHMNARTVSTGASRLTQFGQMF